MSEYNLGPYRMRFQGEYDPMKNYIYMDVVTYDGGSYICINLDTIDGVSCIGILPEGEANSELYWQVIAKRGSKGQAADVYTPYSIVTNGKWDFSITDKIFIPYEATNTLEITNVYDGCCGIIITKKDLTLPANSMKSINYNFIELLLSTDYYFYTFTYSNLGGRDYEYIWHRSVITK